MGYYETREENKKKAENKIVSLRLSQNQLDKIDLIRKWMVENDIRFDHGVYYNYHARTKTNADIIKYLITNFEIPSP
jgi:hypothetical protein